MRDFTLKRFLLVCFAAFSAVSAIASTPSARYETRMAYDSAGRRAILFGGLTAVDTGTKQAYYLNDTWQWSGSRWAQLFPKHSPSGRSGPVFVYDSTRNHFVLFGGLAGATNLNDTWVFDGLDWFEIDTPNKPSARFLAGGAYDSARDRLVVFGGSVLTTSGTSTTINPVYDTWEFDGTTWRQIGGEGPHVAKPMLVYDEQRNKILMLGIDDKGATLMYAYDAGAGTWNELKPSTLPACVNEGIFVYDSTNARPIVTSGICATTTVDNETLAWDGTNWTKLDATINAPRLFGAGAVFDEARSIIVQFGGTPPGGQPLGITYIFTPSTGFVSVTDTSVPGPRSLFAFVTDPVQKLIWLFGGIDGTAVLDDLWAFQFGAWRRVTATDNAPSGCVSPVGAYDTDRQKLVIVCASSSLYEWDGSAWKAFSDLKTVPGPRRFSSMTYDQTLKKIVMFGGFDGNNYLDETWTWDGAQWTRLRNNPAPSRQLAAMWWDPILKKTVIYGGLGRLTSQDRIVRFDDMWAFDGNGWTQLKPSGGTPGMRYGAQVAVDPRTNHTLLFGGLRVDTLPATPPNTVPVQIQVYTDDLWEWDGNAWTRRTTDGTPPARENGGFAYDPGLNVMVLYGGYAGLYLSDMWTLDGNAWRVRGDFGAGGRRRAVSRP